MNSRVKGSKKRGNSGDNQNQTLPSRVRDVFRKGLQWKWDRERDSTLRALKEHETAATSSQKRWPYFAPVAIQRFRRLFSSDDPNNVTSAGCAVIDPECSANITCDENTDSKREVANAAVMVKMKNQGKGNEEPCSTLLPQDAATSLPEASFENSSHFGSIKVPAEKQDQDFAPKLTAESSSKMEVSLFGSTSDNMKSEPSHKQNLIEATKASDKDDISAECDSISDNQLNDCDGKKEILSDTSESVSHENKAQILSIRVLGLSDIEDSACSGNGSATANSAECVAENVCDMNNSSAKLEESEMIISFHDESTNPSIVLSAQDTERTPIHQSRKSLETLYLTLDTTTGVVSTLTRKSPVTVQEWVDSIPLTSHLEEDFEDERTVQELSVTAPEPQDVGDVCPSVTIRPAPGQSGTIATQRREAFSRDASPSVQSDTGSHGSSVDSYLDARRPDPEEVLLGLGFGGPIHNTEAEVSRIPSRFLQPSKVKGVAIDDFLRYQQDLIETFESGHSGYRGLTGGAQIPSVIVAKIMEKLREHERESSTKSSAGSSPGHHPDISKRRFSRAAHRVTILTKMKSRDSIACGPQAHSVLNPDNRKFLDNQGSKSPEVSRKRMIIGHRSFTFDGEGQLIETETNAEETVAPETTAPPKPPPPRPLVHKDSVLSSATSLSLTSYDSDSDTDDASCGDRNIGDIGNSVDHHRLQRYLSSPLGISTSANVILTDSVFKAGMNILEKRRRSLPSASSDLLSNNDHSSGISNHPVCSISDASLDGKSNGQVYSTSTPDKCGSWRDLHRVNSAPIISPISLPSAFSVLGTHKEEIYSTSGELVERNQNRHRDRQMLNANHDKATCNTSNSNRNENYLRISASTSPKSAFYQITDFVLPESPPTSFNSCEVQSSFTGDDCCTTELYPLPKASAMFLDKETRRLLSLDSSADSSNAERNSPDSKHWSLSSMSSWESERTHLQTCEAQDQCTPIEASLSSVETQESDSNITSSRRRGSLKRQQKVDEEDPSVVVLSQCNLHVNVPTKPADKGDSFEMEELAVEDEMRGTRIGSAHSDSSGFQEEQNQNKELPPRAALGKQLSESEPMLYTQIFPDELVVSPTAEHLKRLSLPVIRVQDESGLTQWQASCFGRETVPFSSSLRRVRSLPSQLSRLGVGRLFDTMPPGSISDSIGNMFSSCSDESVIHMPHSSLDKSSGCDKPELLSLHTSILGHEGESEARRASQECCKCNCTLNKSLSKCHNDLSISQENMESFLNISKDLQNLKEAHDRIKNAMLQVQNNLCSTDCSLTSILQQVSQVVQNQTSFSVKLEQLNLDLLSTIGNSSVKDSNGGSNSSVDHDSGKEDVCEQDISKFQHSSENCPLVCRVVERENQRLQDLVRLNVNELAQVRALLEKILPIFTE